MRPPVGTNAWAAVSRGALVGSERIRLTVEAVVAQLSLMPERVRARLGLTGTRSRGPSAADIRFPDSAIARGASEHSRALSPPWLFNHCLRTYVWGALLARGNGIRFDEELFFVACALHDLGLTDAHRFVDATCECFAVEGARAAHAFAVANGRDAEWSDRMSEAISLHLNVRVAVHQGAEAHLLHEGASLDVIGARHSEIPDETLATVLRDHPRLGFQEQLVVLFKEQSRRRPQSRAAFLASIGFIGMIRSSPLDRAASRR
jgi:hypothetical protein